VKPAGILKRMQNLKPWPKGVSGNPKEALPKKRMQQGLEKLALYATAMWRAFEAPAHFRLIADKLEAVEQGKIRRLMLFLPPRHRKSLLSSQFLPAWYLGLHPDRFVISASYGQDLADDFGRKVRNLIADPLHAVLFPECKLSDDSASMRRFGLTAGGSYYAVGRGGPITGRGAHLLLVDDPLKDAATEPQAAEFVFSLGYILDGATGLYALPRSGTFRTSDLMDTTPLSRIHCTRMADKLTPEWNKIVSPSDFSPSNRPDV
jgi:hypothetical protein